MDTLMNYLAMGGYAAWVWPSYGLATIGVVGVLLVSRRTLKTREREFEMLKNARRGGGQS